MVYRSVCGLAILALAGAVMPANAATLYLNNVSPAATETVTFPGESPSTTPYVGAINWTFNRSNADNAQLNTLVSGTSLTTFCIEGTQNVYLNQNAGFDYILSDVASAPRDNVGSLYQMGANAAVLSKFWDAYYGQALVNSTNAAAFQLGVWEIVYDGGTSFSSGLFKASSVAGNATSIAALAQAQSWLSGLNAVTPTEHYQLYVLSDPSLQDQVFSVAVPLPAALPVGMALLAGLGFVRHIRRKRDLRA